jgi:hypothetical protein
VVGRNGETLDELLGQVTPENGGLVNRADGRAVGNPESQRVFDEAVARGVTSPPKGPKPVIEKASATASPDSGVATLSGNPSPPSTPTPSPQGFVLPRPRRVTGPQTPEDAWKWEGVPEGYTLLGPVEPGKKRHYAGDDGHGPKIGWLPPVWPPGEGPTDAAGAAG